MASVTITQVAEAAGVSMKTVSRVLNGEPHVREEVRGRVLEAAKTLRYRPQMSARSLAGSRSFVVGYLLTDPSIPYHGHAQLGALQACRRAGYHLMVEGLDLASPQLDADLDGLFGAVPVDGVLLMPPLCDNAAVLEALDRAGTPYVRVSPGREPDRSPSVDIDDRAAARELTRHLIGLGHREIGFVMGDPGHGSAGRRLEGYQEALAEAGLAARPELVRPGRYAFQSGVDAAEALLALERAPTAIFASNDTMALGVISAAFGRGLKVPQDLSVVGFDDSLGQMAWPALTTVRQPVADMAAAATRIIIDQSRTRSPAPRQTHQILPSPLVIRDSAAPPRGQPEP